MHSEPEHKRLALYVDAELGAYGYEEKPWYLPGVRLEAFLSEARRRGLLDGVCFLSAAPATDEELCLFHTKDHVDQVLRRCHENEGSLDGAVPQVVQDALRLLDGVRTATDASGRVRASELRRQLADSLVPAMGFDTYLAYLASEGLWRHDPAEDTLTLGPRAQAFLTSSSPRLTGPTLARRGVERAARWVCGAALDATRRILRGECQRVFIPIAGFHHAHASEARLYCLYNDPALAITEALKGVSGRVAYIDIDIHQGDGVYEAFASEPRVVIADLHESPSTLFPYTPQVPGTGQVPETREDTGRANAKGTKLNIPLPPYTDDAAYLEMWEEAESFIRAAKPEFIVFESGVDGLASDPLSNQGLSPGAMAAVTRRVCGIADDYAGGRLLALGGGGYELEGTKQGWCAVLEALLKR